MKAVIYTGGSLLGKELVEELRISFREVVVYNKGEEIPDKVSDDPIDLLLLVGGGEEETCAPDEVIGTAHDYDAISAYLAKQMRNRYDLIEKYEKALQRGQGKRIGFVSYRWASVTDNPDTTQFALHMDAAGMSMQAKLCHEKYHNRRRNAPDELSVRFFAAEPDVQQRKKGISAVQYMQMDFCQDTRRVPYHYEENHLRMRDHKFVQIPW